MSVAAPQDVSEAAPNAMPHVAVSVAAPLNVTESAPAVQVAPIAVIEVWASGDDMDVDYPPVSPLSFSAATIPNPLLPTTSTNFPGVNIIPATPHTSQEVVDMRPLRPLTRSQSRSVSPIANALASTSLHMPDQQSHLQLASPVAVRPFTRSQSRGVSPNTEMKQTSLDIPTLGTRSRSTSLSWKCRGSQDDGQGTAKKPRT